MDTILRIRAQLDVGNFPAAGEALHDGDPARNTLAVCASAIDDLRGLDLPASAVIERIAKLHADIARAINAYGNSRPEQVMS